MYVFYYFLSRLCLDYDKFLEKTRSAKSTFLLAEFSECTQDSKIIVCSRCDENFDEIYVNSESHFRSKKNI